MILTNYWRWLRTITMNSVQNVTGARVPCHMNTIEGETTSEYYVEINDQPCNMFYRLGARFGSGSSDISPLDYCLANDITSSISSVSFSAQSNSYDNLTRTFTITGTNSSNSELEITQIGIARDCRYVGSNGMIKTNPVMFAIIILDEPIKLEPADDFTTVIEWVEM